MDTEIGNIEARSLPLAGQTSETLLRRVRDWGDSASWRQFFATYSRMIHTSALKAGLTETEADDVVQTTMIGVADRIRSFQYDRSTGSFKAWLSAQAKSRIGDCLRRRKREQEVFQQRRTPATHSRTATVERCPDHLNDPAILLDRDWNEVVAETAMARVKERVSPKQFQVFDLYVVKQWPLRRISRTLGVSVAQVYLVKSRVSFLLRQQTRHVQAHLNSLPPPEFPQPNQPNQ
jgi:RNA polymerase sigma factor (sigma-70 family)